MRLAIALLAAVALAAGPACGDDDSVRVEPPATTTTLADDLEPVGDLTSGPRQSDEFATNETALLTDVRVAEHTGFTRVVFELKGEAPGWIAEYQEGPVTEDPSGRTIDVEGDAFLRVTMSAASAVDLSEEEPVVTFGPDRVAGAGERVHEVVNVGDFEAVLTWVIGLDTEAPFAVATFDEPSRIVVDIEA